LGVLSSAIESLSRVRQAKPGRVQVKPGDAESWWQEEKN
jgi:hypothetical protein